jgi:PTS system nitrogen regulatory IIA component
MMTTTELRPRSAVPGATFTPQPSRILLDVSQNSRRAVVQTITRAIAADLNLHAAGVADMMRAGATTQMQVEGGVAVIDQCSEQIDEPYLLVARLTHAVDFHAPDNRHVDLVCVLLSPAGSNIDHIRMLGRLTRQLHDAAFADTVRSATSVDAVRALFLLQDSVVLAA